MRPPSRTRTVNNFTFSVAMMTYIPSLHLHPFFQSLPINTAVLLHPRRAPTTLSPYASKIGGRFAWPSSEPWPICPVDSDPMVPVVQLTKHHVPELQFPPAKDLFQMLWCPRQDHTLHSYAPVARVFWRDSALLSSHPLLECAPLPSKRSDYECIPKECLLHPERVEEFPSVYQVGNEDHVRIIDEFIRRNGAEDVRNLKLEHDSELYFYMFSAAPVSKVGGHVSWLQHPVNMSCERCARDMEHLMTLSSCETGNLGRWNVIDDSRAGQGTGWVGGDETVFDDVYKTGLCLGDMGNFYVFICRQCRGWPLKTLVQSS